MKSGNDVNLGPWKKNTVSLNCRTTVPKAGNVLQNVTKQMNEHEAIFNFPKCVKYC